MAARDQIEITESLRAELSAIFRMQYSEIESKIRKLFVFSAGDFSVAQEYESKISFTENNIVYSWDLQPVMSVFAFTGRRLLRLEKIFKIKSPNAIGVRIFKNCQIPMHVDPNQHSIGRESPVRSIILSASPDAKIFFSNQKDGSKQVILPGVSEFIMSPTEIAHGCDPGDQDMDVLQMRLDSDSGL